MASQATRATSVQSSARSHTTPAHEMTERFRQIGALVLPALLALFPVATVERACACVEELLRALANASGEGAAECFERHEATLGALDRTLYDVIVMAVIRMAPAQTIDVLSGGGFEGGVIEHAILSVKSVRDRFAPTTGERIEDEGGAIPHGHPREEELLAQRMNDDDVERRALVVAALATLPPDNRTSVMGQIELWLYVQRGVFAAAKRAAPKSSTPEPLLETSRQTLWDTDDRLTENCPNNLVQALAGAWFGRGACRVWRALEEDYSCRNEVIFETERALEDLNHARTIFGLAASEGGAA